MAPPTTSPPGLTASPGPKKSKLTSDVLEEYCIYYYEEPGSVDDLPYHISKLQDHLLNFRCTLTRRFEPEISKYEPRQGSCDDACDRKCASPRTHRNYTKVDWEALLAEVGAGRDECQNILNMARRSHTTQTSVEDLLRKNEDEAKWKSLFLEKFLKTPESNHPALSGFYHEAYA